MINLRAHRRRHNAKSDGEELRPFPAAPKDTMESVRHMTLRFQHCFDLARCRTKLIIMRSSRALMCSSRPQRPSNIDPAVDNVIDNNIDSNIDNIHATTQIDEQTQKTIEPSTRNQQSRN